MLNLKIFNFGRRLSQSAICSLEDTFPNATIEEIDIRFDLDLHGNIAHQITNYVDRMNLAVDDIPVVALGGLAVGMAYLVARIIERHGFPYIVETIKLEREGGRYGLKGVYWSKDGSPLEL